MCKKKGITLTRVRMLLAATLLAALSGCGHDPNHDIDMEQAQEAANRVHKPPKPGEKMIPGAGG